MITLNQADLDRVKGLPSRKAAQALGVGKSTVNKYRAIADANGGTLPLLEENTADEPGTKSSLETRRDGDLIVTTQATIPQSKGDIEAAMIARGFSPDEYDFTYRFSEWEAQSPQGVTTMYAARAGATPKRAVAHAAALDVDELLDAVANWQFTPIIKDAYSSADAVLMFADPQFGKTDADGGTEETLSQVMQSFAEFTEIVKEEKPHDVLFGDLGDGLENFNNTSNQRETNDLDLTSQVRLLRRTQAEGLRMIAPHCKRVRHRSVNSNHGVVRIAPQMQASTPSNDWGLEVSHQLEEAFAESRFDNIDFGRPIGDHAISLRVDLENGTRIGMNHGDQAAQNALATWWMRQAFGWDNPLRDVDLLLYGHHHNQAIEEVFEGRWAIGGASSDRGSAWFTNKTGRSATSGMTSFLTADGKFWRLELI